MKKMHILVFGGSGLIGSSAVNMLRLNYKISAPTHDEVNITNKNSLLSFIHKLNPDYILNCAGVTNMEFAEENRELAYAVNTKAAEYMALASKELEIPLMYISTDAVFDGKKSESAYTEDDKPNPINFYGYTKYEGEKIVLNICSKSCVVRTSLPFSSNFDKKTDLVRNTIIKLKNNEKMSGISNQIINPIFVKNLIKSINSLVDQRIFGVYHVSALDYVSNLEFLRKIALLFRFDTGFITSMTLSDFELRKKVKHAQYHWLSPNKILKVLGRKAHGIKSIDENLEYFGKSFS